MVSVEVHITLWAHPQYIAPKGRWSWELNGKGFSVQNDGNVAYSVEGATKAAKRICKKLGFKMDSINVERL
jgi:hypothetical protein